MAPYYDRAREICQAPSDDWDLETWSGRDRYDPLHFDPTTVTTRIAQIVPKKDRSFAGAYRDQLASLPTVTTYLYANVTDIEVDGSGSSVTRVAVRTLAELAFTSAEWGG